MKIFSITSEIKLSVDINILIEEIKTLYEDYGNNKKDQFSEETSSHWRDYGRKTHNLTGNDFEQSP